MLKSYNFPSVYEATNQELANVAENILDGLKINLDDTDYIVGNLALVEGYSPHKSINAAPTDEEYKLLSEASLLLTQPKGEEEIYLTTGFQVIRKGSGRRRKLCGITFSSQTHCDVSPGRNSLISSPVTFMVLLRKNRNWDSAS